MNSTKNLDWTGWKIDSNIHGEEFDLPARKRMLEGGQKLKSHILKYISRENASNILEIGPFFNPLIKPKEFALSNIYYWEGDKYALEWLKNEVCKTSAKQTSAAILCDLNLSHKPDFLKLIKEKMAESNANIECLKFDVIIISQVFNYVDYKELLKVVSQIISKKGKLFINNVTDHGLPKFFSDKRPKSNKELVETVSEIGFTIIDEETIPFYHEDNEFNRLLLSVEKNNL